MNRDIYVTDKTALELCGASPEGLEQFLDLVLGTGITKAEVRSSQFKLLKNTIHIEKMAVRIQNADELKALRRMGATWFVTDAGSFFNSFENNDLYAMTVEIAADDVTSLFQNSEKAKMIRDRGAKIRLTGLPDVFCCDYREFFKRVIEIFGNDTSADFSNRLLCATAASYEWIKSGGGEICASFSGAGNRACTEELLAAFNVIEDSNFNLLNMPQIRNVYEKLTGKKVEDFKPVAGRDIFAFESGIHADGIFKNPINYEPFMPESVGGRRRLVIGKHSGRQALRVKLSELNIKLDKRYIDAANEAVRLFAIRKHRALRDEEIKIICENVISQEAANYEG